MHSGTATPRRALPREPAEDAARPREHWRLPRRGATALPDLIRPAHVGGPVAWEDLVRRGALRPLWGDVALVSGTTPTPALRAAAVRGVVPLGNVLAGAGAAWVLCGSALPAVFDVIYPPRAHRPAPHRDRASRQATVFATERLCLSGVLVTNAQRTAWDVATRVPFDEALATLRRLAAQGLDLAAAAQELELRFRWNGRHRAREVLYAAQR